MNKPRPLSVGDRVKPKQGEPTGAMSNGYAFITFNESTPQLERLENLERINE